MAINEIKTRIALKYDTYENWLDTNKGANKVLLRGEIGICEIPSGNHAATTAPTVLFKVGGDVYPAGHEKAGQLKAFKDLPWASALAADVYSWAKANDIRVTANTTKNAEGKDVPDGTYSLSFVNVTRNGETEAVTTIKSVNLSTFATVETTDAFDARLGAVEVALGLATPGDGESTVTVETRLAAIDAALKSILGDDQAEEEADKLGLIAAGDKAVKTEIEALLGLDDNSTCKFTDTNTVANAIEDAADNATEAAGTYTDTAINALFIDAKTGDDAATNLPHQGKVKELTETVESIGGSVDTIEGLLDGLTKSTVVAEIDDKISVFKTSLAHSGTAGTNQVVKAVTQTDGVVTVTYGGISEAELPNISAEKIVVTPETASGKNDAVMLDDKLTAIGEKIDALEGSIAGGVHFRGIVKPDDEGNEVDMSQAKANVALTDKADFTAEKGDVVLQNSGSGAKEFIWTGTAWEELGDVTRIGAVEQAVTDVDDRIDGLNETKDANAGKFATKVEQSAGQINVTYGNVAATDVSYGTDSTVDAALTEQDQRIDAIDGVLADLDTDTVKEEIAADIEAAIADLTGEVAKDDKGVETSGAFVTSVTQAAGVVTVTYGDLPNASDETAGIVKLGAAGGAATYADVAALKETLNGKTVEGEAVPGVVAKLEAAEGDIVELDGRVDAIEANYAQAITDPEGTTKKVLAIGADVIIFNCGSASEGWYQD